MEVNLQNRVPLQQANVLFTFDHVLKEPDVFILRKLSTTYKDKFSDYIDWSYISTLSDKTLLSEVVNRDEPDVLKWVSLQEFEYEKNYEFLFHAWKDMYANAPTLLGKMYLNRFLRSYCINDIYVWNEDDDIRQRYDLVSTFGDSKIQYVTGPLDKVLDQLSINIVYDYSAKRVADLIEDYKYGNIIFGVATYGFNFETEGLFKLKYGLNERKNVTTFQIIDPKISSEFKG